MKIILIACSFVVLLGLSGCETMQGIGKDLQSAGTAIQKKAAE